MRPIFCFLCGFLLSCGSARARAGEVPEAEGETVKTSPGLVARLATREAEADPIYGLAFSPGGGLLAAATSDSKIRIWETRTHERYRILRGKDEGFSSVAFSPGGQCIAAGGGDGTLRVWEAASGKELAALKASDSGLYGIAFSPDGRALATVNNLGDARVWDWRAGSSTLVCTGNGNALASVAYAPDGKLLAAGGAVGLLLWETREFHALYTLGSPPQAMAFVPSWGLLAALHDAELQFWDPEIGQESTRRPCARGGQTRLACALDGKLAAVGTEQGTVRLWELTGLQETLELTGHERQIEAVAFSPDGRLLASGGADGVVLIWDFARLAWPAPAAADPEQLWTLLGGAAASEAQGAVWALVLQGEPGVAGLKERLHAAPAGDPDEVPRLIAALDSENFEARERAAERLKKLGRGARPALQAALKEAKSEEQRRQIHTLLVHPNLPLPVQSGDDLRAARAVQVLEAVGSPAALGFLQALALGGPDAFLTCQAQAAVARLAQRGDAERAEKGSLREKTVRSEVPESNPKEP